MLSLQQPRDELRLDLEHLVMIGHRLSLGFSAFTLPRGA
jgi:hypothetical protein